MSETKKQNKKSGKVKQYFKARNSRLFAIILLSIMLPAMIFVVAPFEIYCNNISELAFSAKEFLGMQVSLTVLAALIFFCILYFIPNMVYKFLYPALFGILLMLFLQTNYLNLGLNSLAGDDLDASKTSTFTYIWNTSLWLIVIIGFVVLFQFVKIQNIVKLISLVLTIAITATQLMNFTITLLNTDGAFSSAIERTYGKYEDKPRFITYKDINAVGSDRNVIFFCVDRMDTLLYADLAMEKYPETFKKLDGFTYYSDMTSMYGYTFPSVAYMMSGIKYDNGNQKEYFSRVYNENQTINALHKNGYNINLFSEAYYDYSNANEMPTYIENVVETSKDTLYTKVRRPIKFSWSLTQTALYRSLPFILKDDVGSINSDTFNGYILYESEDLQGQRNYSYELKHVYDEVKKFDGNFQTKTAKTVNGIDKQGDKNFSFIHVSGCHTAEYDENWKKTSKTDYLVSAKNSIEFINMYLENMKAISPELYKNSTIVIMADHGKVTHRHDYFTKPMISAAFIKRAGDDFEGYRTSDAPVSSANLWATIFQSEGLTYDKSFFGDSFFDVESAFNTTGVYPVREFVWTRRNKQLTEYDSITYKIEGSARDFANWRVDKVEHIPHPLFAN